jgi:hypothetical protein
VVPCSFAVGYQHVGEPCCLYLQSEMGPEDGGSMDLCNFGILPQHYTASQPEDGDGMVKVKGKVVPVLNEAPRHEDALREWRYSSTHSLTSALDGG